MFFEVSKLWQPLAPLLSIISIPSLPEINVNESSIVNFILLFSWIKCFWEIYLSYRQIKVYQTNTSIPNELNDIIDEESFEKAREYGIHYLQFTAIHNLCSVIMSSMVLRNRWIAKFWQKAEFLALLIKIKPEQEILISCMFVNMATLFTLALNMPFYIYETFVLEQKYGFNKQTVGFFVQDQLKYLIVNLVLTLPILSSIIYIVQLGGNMLAIWLWLFTSVATFVLLTIYPSVIAPVFDKFTPLADGELRQKIKELADKLEFPLTQIYLVEGSKRSAHSNAYFNGMFGEKRIILFDTLIERYDEENNVISGCTDDEILGILAHELGHWKCNHLIKFLALMELNLLLLFVAFGFLFRNTMLYAALGFTPEEKPVIIGLIGILNFVLAPYNSIFLFLATALSRKFEFEADDFAVNLSYPSELRSSLIKLEKDNLDYPWNDKIYSTWYHSHPTLLQRLDNIRNSNKQH